MKYRIQTTLFKSGKRTFTAQVKKNFIWWQILPTQLHLIDTYPVNSREKAFNLIDCHFESILQNKKNVQDNKVQSIIFEYLNK